MRPVPLVCNGNSVCKPAHAAFASAADQFVKYLLGLCKVSTVMHRRHRDISKHTQTAFTSVESHFGSTHGNS